MGVVAKFFAHALHATAKKPPIVNPGYAPVLSHVLSMHAHNTGPV